MFFWEMFKNGSRKTTHRLGVGSVMSDHGLPRAVEVVRHHRQQVDVPEFILFFYIRQFDERAGMTGIAGRCS